MDITNILFEAVRFGDLKSVTEIINTHGLSYSESWAMGYNLLIYSIRNEHDEVTKFLLSNGAKVNISYNKRRRSKDTPLHLATQNGNLEIVQTLLENGANIHAKNEYGATALQNAIYRNKLDVAELLLSRGANVNVKCKGLTLLHTAVQRGNINAVQMLLKYKVNVNVITKILQKHGQTPLHFAADSGKERIVELLLQNGASIEAKANGLSPVYYAAMKGKDKVVQLLLKHGANVDAHDADGKTILFLAVEHGSINMVNSILERGPSLKNKMNNNSLKKAINGSKEKYKLIVEKLLEYGFSLEPDINLLQTAINKGYTNIVKNYLSTLPTVKNLLNTLTDNSTSLLIVAVQKSHYDIVQMLIRNGSNPNLKDGSGLTALFYATSNGDIKMVQILLAKGATVTNCSGLLINAVKREMIQMVHLLLDNNVNVKEVDALGRTALHYCALDTVDSDLHADICMEVIQTFKKFGQAKDSRVKKDIAKVLLEAGAEVNALSKDGRSALHWACANGYYDVVDTLFQYNAKMFADEANTLPLHLSACSGNIDIVKLLISKGAEVNAKTKLGMTVLHFATYELQTEILEYLIALGINIDEGDQSGSTALHIAARSDYYELVEFLLKNGADINSSDNNGRTPLNIATTEGNERVVRTLLEYGCDLRSQGKKKISTPDAELMMMLGIDEFPGMILPSDNDDDDDGDYYGPGFAYDQYDDYYDYDDYDDLDDLDDYDDYGYVDIENYESDEENIDYNNEHNIFSSNKVNQLLQLHVIRMKAASLPIKEETLPIDTIINNQCEAKFKLEVDKLKKEKICDNTNVTFYDILSKSIDNVAIYTRNPKILEILTKDDYQTKFPEYYGLIKGKIVRGINRKNLLDKGYAFFDFLSDGLAKRLPYNCVENICSYLSDNELRILAEAVKS